MAARFPFNSIPQRGDFFAVQPRLFIDGAEHFKPPGDGRSLDALNPMVRLSAKVAGRVLCYRGAPAYRTPPVRGQD